MSSLTIDGLNDAISAMGDFIEDTDITAFNSVDQVLATIEKDMVTKASGKFNKYAEGVLVNSISHVTVLKGDDGVFGSVGVYDMSNKTGSQDRLPIPIITTFLQGGVQPHSLVAGSRAPKRGTPKNLVDQYNADAKANSPGLWHPGFQGYPFLRIAFTENVDKLGEVTVRNFERTVKKL